MKFTTAIARTMSVVLIAGTLCALMLARAASADNGKELLRALDQAYVEIWQEVHPAVVNVDTKREIVRTVPPSLRDFLDEFGWRLPQQGPGSRTEERIPVPGRGSGFVIDPEGYVLTNYHVVENATEILVRFGDSEVYPATLVGKDRNTDIALLKIDAGKPLPAAKLGDSDKLRVGQIVMAIGNPRGTLERTLTVGHVSGLGRMLWEFVERMRPEFQDFIQTDAAINMGNSGGPLVNIEGEVVGINTAMAPFAQSIGFAVPINFAKDILEDLKEKGRAVRGYLGVKISNLEPGLGEEYGLTDDKGALVQTVVAESPAEKAGIQVYDVITEIDDQEIATKDDLVRVIQHIRPGTKVRVKYVRDRKQQRTTVELEELSDKGGEAASSGPQMEKALGIDVVDIPTEILEKIGLEKGKGVMVHDADPNGAAAKEDIKRGDVILEVNRRAIRNASQFRRAVERTEEGEWIVMLVFTDGQTRIVHIRKPELAD